MPRRRIARAQALVVMMFLWFVTIASADPIDDRIVDLTAATSTNSPRITLSWTHRLSSSTLGYSVFRRLKGQKLWNKLAELSSSSTIYPDATALTGINYEYKVERRLTESSSVPPIAYGYVCSGVNVPATEFRGKLVLLVDQTMATPLSAEISELIQDLTGDGWQVLRHDVPRMAEAPATTGTNVGPARLAEVQAIKNLIRADYLQDPANVKAVYLLGRVPVPYSGRVYPDGHSDHRGAWPADVYYADMAEVEPWTDQTIDNSTANLQDQRNRNIPGDGKFDNNRCASAELQVGRVDLSNLTQFPNAATSETELLRRYLKRAHDFRHRQGEFTSVSRLALINYFFSYDFVETKMGFAWSGWMTGYSWFGRNGIRLGRWFDLNQTDNAVNNSYLFGYADGFGAFDSIAGVATSADFGTTRSRVVFNALFGSYFGDWDRANCVLRAPLAGTTNSHGLVTFWAGSEDFGDVWDDNANTFRTAYPSWLMNPMAIGETVGYCARLAQSYDPEAYGAWTPLRQAGNIYPALMGDPALRAFVPPPVSNLNVTNTNGIATLAWSASSGTNLLGYLVYRAAQATGPFTRLNSTLLTTNTWTDTAAPVSGTWHYMVRAVASETTGSGNYQNPSQGVFAATALTVTNAYGLWAATNGLVGDAALPSAMPARDGIPNLMKFGLGLSALQSGYQGRLNQSLLTAGGGNFLALTYTRPEPAPAGVSYTVETCDNLINWSANETVAVSTNHHGNGTVSIVVRDTIGTPPASKRFIRLKVLPAP